LVEERCVHFTSYVTSRAILASSDSMVIAALELGKFLPNVNKLAHIML
jgi:hypothetical protein